MNWKNDFICNFSSSNNEALADQEVSKVGDYLIIQVKHFLVFGQVVTKYISKTCCTPTPTVPVTLDADIVDHKKLNVTTTINHSGNLERAQYTSFIKSTSSSWFQCNNAAAVPWKETALSNGISYIFFYKNVSWEREKGRGELCLSKCWSLQ